VLVVGVASSSGMTAGVSAASAVSPPAAMPLISRGVPVSTSSQIYPVTWANDADYSTKWRGAIPGWIAFDLSGVPAGRRAQVIIAWYNDPSTSPYDHTMVGEVAYNSLRDYTVQANAAPGGATPTTGWATLATVTGNRYHSRQHAVDMTGYNWIRLSITAGDGSSGNSDASVNIDIHDASQGAQDDWIFLGDSITEDGTHHDPINGVGNFGQTVNAAKPGYYPAYEDGGTYGLISQDGAQNIAKWLSVFPGRFVGISFGTNDANACLSPTTYYNNEAAMVQAVIAAGKVPVVPTIPWARTSNIQNCGPGLNAQIQALYAAYPQIVKGPDLWTFFKNNPTLIGSDNLHPSTAGYGAYRQQWTNAAVANVYNAAPAGPSVSTTPGSLAFGSQRVGTPSTAQSTVVRNTGAAPLTISGIGLTGANASDFSWTSDCPASPSTLGPNATCSISVRFSPTTTGTRTATVQISDNASDSPQSVALAGTGTAPAISLTPASLTFAAQPIGTTSASQTTTVRNTGTAPLTISSVTPSGANASDYSATHNCPTAPATLAVNATCSIAVSFSPHAAGPSTGSIAIVDDAPGSPQSVSLSGSGTSPQPAVSLAPASLSFSSQLVGSQSAAQTSVLKNTGNAALVIMSIDMTGANATDFPSSNDCPHSPAALAPNATCTISVAFAPSASGGRTAAVTISDNAGGSPHTLPLSGTGTTPAPLVTLSPAGLSFGPQRVGTTSSTLTSTLTNTGNASLTIRQIALAGAAPGDYSEYNDCPVSPATLGAGGSCTVSVAFRPGTTGTRTARVDITDDAAGSPQAISLTGTATAPAVTLTPTTVPFGAQLIGTTSSPQTVTVRNSGTAPLSISGLGVTGANASDFAATSNCPISPASVAPNATCTVSVTFSPTALGARSATLALTDDAADSPQAVALSGTGSNGAAIALDKTLGKFSENIGSSTMKLTTSATAASGSRVFLFVNWNNATRTLTSVTGGGLTWGIDVQAKDAGNNHGAIVSASAPAGLPSGTVLTATFSGSVGHGLIAAVSFTGIAGASPVDAVGSSTQAGANAWSAAVTATNANDLVLGWTGVDANGTSTPAAPNVELYDFGDANLYEWGSAVYRIDTTSGSKTVNGTWTRASGGSSANVTVVAAYRAG